MSLNSNHVFSWAQVANHLPRRLTSPASVGGQCLRQAELTRCMSLGQKSQQTLTLAGHSKASPALKPMDQCCPIREMTLSGPPELIEFVQFFYK